jgi:hypothetical protein
MTETTPNPQTGADMTTDINTITLAKGSHESCDEGMCLFEG